MRRNIQDPAGSFFLSSQPKVDLLPPKRNAAALIGQELSSMKDILALENASTIPERIVANKYFHVRLSTGRFAGTVPSAEDVGDRRRDHLVGVRSHVGQGGRRGQATLRVEVNVYGAVRHSADVLIDGKPQAFAYIKCVKSALDRHGGAGLAEKRRDTECFTSLGGVLRGVNEQSINAVGGTLFVRDKHVVLYTREVFSNE